MVAWVPGITLPSGERLSTPLIAWTLPSRTTFPLSPGIGLTDQSVGALFRFSVAQEIDDFARVLKPFQRH